MRAWGWTILLLACLGASIPLQRWMDRQVGPAAEEALYIPSGRMLRRASLGFEGVLADLYWLRTVQYFGQKMDQVKGKVDVGDVSGWGLNLLEPMLNITTELDPQYLVAYRFGALFLPDIDREGAIKYVRRGIENNPGEWRLYQDLGYIFWKQGRFAESGEIYEQGSRVAGAPEWMKSLAAVMKLRGGDRATAKDLFRRLYEGSDDEYTKRLALARLESIRAEEEIEFLNHLAGTYRTRRGACPPSLSALMQSLPQASIKQMMDAGLHFGQTGAPLDPTGHAYAFDAANCAAELAQESPVLRWKNQVGSRE